MSDNRGFIISGDEYKRLQEVEAAFSRLTEVSARLQTALKRALEQRNFMERYTESGFNFESWDKELMQIIRGEKK